MAIIRWNPMRWPSLWDEDEDWSALSSWQGWQDNLDVYETENEVVAKASVAGVDPEKVDITFQKGVLWITAKEEEEKKEGKKYYKKSTRSYNYKVAIPGNVDHKKEPEATFHNGVLTVKFHKAESEKPKKITVKKTGQ
jgi:HSP20 family protein